MPRFPVPSTPGADAASRPHPGRFRRRLTGAFIGTVAAAGALLALTAYFTIHQDRERTFRQSAEEQVELSLLSAPRELSLEDFEELLVEYHQRAGFETVAVAGETVFASSPGLGPDDVPFDDDPAPGELVSGLTEVEGEPFLVVGGTRPGSPVLFYFFFPRQLHLSSLREVATVLAGAWTLAVVAAALVGHAVARRTLRPVRAAAEASQSLAEGLLETRLTFESDDEFGVWVDSFNQMADALAAKIEALSEARERERQFTADVAHELRTPLAGMVNAASLLADELDSLPEGARRPAGLLVDDVRRLHGLVLELLELARLDAGKEGVDTERLDLRAAVTAVVRPWQDDPGVAVDVDIGDGLAVMADRRRLHRVVSNLVTNAVRHGGGAVEIAARPDGDALAIEVQDRGPGLGRGDDKRIFDRFYKSDSSRSRGGSGLGLAIAREHALAQGGTLTAANRIGGGACFTLRLPAAPTDDDDRDEGLPSGDSQPGSPASARIRPRVRARARDTDI